MVRFMPEPNTSVLAPRVDSTETASTAEPAMVSRSRLLKRVKNGFGRLLRGTAQAVFMVFWMA